MLHFPRSVPHESLHPSIHIFTFKYEQPRSTRLRKTMVPRRLRGGLLRGLSHQVGQSTREFRVFGMGPAKKATLENGGNSLVERGATLARGVIELGRGRRALCRSLAKPACVRVYRVATFCRGISLKRRCTIAAAIPALRKRRLHRYKRLFSSVKVPHVPSAQQVRPAESDGESNGRTGSKSRGLGLGLVAAPPPSSVGEIAR